MILSPLELHHLAPRRRSCRSRSGRPAGAVRVGHADLQRVAVQGLEALDLAVVVKGLLASMLALRSSGEAEDLEVLQQVEVLALPARVVVALEAVDIVLRGQLALLALEGRVVGKVDAGLDL